MRKIDWLIIAFVVLVSIITLKDLFKPGFYTSHDGVNQIVRLYYFDQALKDGQIPPRWVGALLNGFGYPLFNFSYHLPWLIAEPIHLIGFSIIDSIKMTFLIGFILSGITMYFFQKELLGRLPAVCGTVLYLFAPYRFSNIFVRGALGDATSFIFPPLLFLALYKLKRKGKMSWQWIMFGAIAMAGLILSHAMVFLFFLMSYVFYVFYSLFFMKKRLPFLTSVILIIFLAIGIASYYFLPSLLERNWTKFSEIMARVYQGNTFLTLEQLIYSPWGYGTMDANEGRMSFQLGITQWLIVIFSSIMVVAFSLKKLGKPKNGLYKEVIYYLLLFYSSIFLILPTSSFFWNIFSRITVIDFTWRLLPVTIFAVSVLAGLFISRVKFPSLVVVLLIILALYANRNHLRINQSLDWPESFYLQLVRTTNTFDEYTPKWVRWEVLEKPKPKVVFSNDKAKIDILVNKSNYLQFLVDTSESGRVRVNTIYYPGWRVEENGKEKVIRYKDSGGLIEFDIASGSHLLELKFRETLTRKIANSITIASFVVILLGISSSVLDKLKREGELC